MTNSQACQANSRHGAASCCSRAELRRSGEIRLLPRRDFERCSLQFARIVPIPNIKAVTFPNLTRHLRYHYETLCLLRPIAIHLFGDDNRATAGRARGGAGGICKAHLAGGQGVSFSYTQGDGTRSVTYTATNPGYLAALIRQLQQQLGIICRGRAPIRFWYR